MATYVTDTLTATAATVIGLPTPTRTWQWLRGSTTISGATTNSYTVTSEDLGQSITARQTETNFLGTASATSVADGSVLPFTPTALFALNEPGVWYDPSDITTLYTDNVGTTPVTAPGQTVGLMLDKSQNGVGTNGASRRNLLTFSEQFDNVYWNTTAGSDNAEHVQDQVDIYGNANSAWTISDTSSSLIETIRGSVAVPANTATYVASVFIKKTSGAVTFPLLTLIFSGGTSVGSQYIFDTNNGGLAVRSGATGTGGFVENHSTDYWRVSWSATNNSTNNALRLDIYTAATNATDGTGVSSSVTGSIVAFGAQLELGSAATTYQKITSDWVSTIAGNHATQSILGQRPTYGVVPKGGRRNLLTWSEDFRTTAQIGTTRPWVSAGGTITADQGSAPDGTTTADRMVTVATANTIKAVYASLDLVAGTHTLSAYVKDNESTARTADLFFGTPTLSATVGTSYNFDTDTLTNGATAAPFTFVASSRTSIGSGWLRLSVTVTVASAQTVRLYIAAAYAAAQAGNYLIWGAQLELGSTATPYQRVSTIFDVTEAGVTSVGYLAFETDKWMVTPTITPGTDKVQVFAGVRKLSDATAGLVAELSPTSATNTGVFSLFAPTGSSANYFYRSKGTVAADALSPLSFSAPTSNLLCGLSDISGDLAILRVNGTQVAQSAGDQGTGNYDNHALYIGRRGGSSLPFNGHLYPLIIRFGPNLSTERISAMESWVSTKTPGVTL